MAFRKSDLFVQFRAFYIKEFTKLKKVTNKLFKSVRCVVIAKRGRGVWSAKRIRLVVCRCGNVYIKNFIFLIDTEEVGIYIYSP